MDFTRIIYNTISRQWIMLGFGIYDKSLLHCYSNLSSNGEEKSMEALCRIEMVDMFILRFHFSLYQVVKTNVLNYTSNSHSHFLIKYKQLILKRHQIQLKTIIEQVFSLVENVSHKPTSKR